MKTDKQFYMDTLGWGFLLWLIGYIFGIILFFTVPKLVMGFILTPVMAIATIFVLLKKIKPVLFSYYVPIAIIWLMLAMILDYIFIVKAFNPADGYYNADVYLYYGLIFCLPLLVGWLKENKSKENKGE